MSEKYRNLVIDHFVNNFLENLNTPNYYQLLNLWDCVKVLAWCNLTTNIDWKG